MDYTFYYEETIKILKDLRMEKRIADIDLIPLVDHISLTISQYHKGIRLDKLKAIIFYFLFYSSAKYLELPEIKEKEREVESKRDETLISISKKDLISEPWEESISHYFHVDWGHITHFRDLIIHQYEYPHPQYIEKIYQERGEKVKKLAELPQAVQKSAEWFAQRNNCLTATAIATVLDEDPYKYPIDLLLDKCFRGEEFKENENVHHGKKYEYIGNMIYSFRNNVKVLDFGLLQHQAYPFIGASPDGICSEQCQQNGLTTLVGRALEIKFPKRRKIKMIGDLNGDICPHYYFLQVQTQLFVTGLDECDFFQCSMGEYRNWEEFLEDTHSQVPSFSQKFRLEKGCLIQLAPKNLINGDPSDCLYHSQYLYPPQLHLSPTEIKNWIAEEIFRFPDSAYARDYVIDRVIYWRVEKISCHLIKKDERYISDLLPQIRKFWKYVLFYRKNPQLLDKLQEDIKDIPHKESRLIFQKIHEDYEKNTGKKSKPLYQEQNEWRLKYQKSYQYAGK